MKRVNIITRDNSGGLTRDANILANILRPAGFQVSIFEVGKPTVGHKIHRITTYLEKFSSNTFKGKPPYDVNLFLEDVVPAWFNYAPINCLIPNQEWFRDESRAYLPQFDYILCKTKFAEDIFQKLGCKTELISFTSLDRFRPQQSKDYNLFFHLAGNNLQRATNTLVNLWLQHPEWPQLTVVQKRERARIVTASNIKFITEYLEDEVLAQYQNSQGIHVCPSEAEGFGHYIVEAMSCKAVTITTNAPPMNEIITPVRGLLADYSNTKPHKLGINYYVDPQSLEQKINEVLDMTYSQKKQLGENGRSWYLDNDKFFRQRIVEVIAGI